jgi:hypothetical protein
MVDVASLADVLVVVIVATATAPASNKAGSSTALLFMVTFSYG